MIEKIGRYEILDKIGEGGFAIVYRARDTELGRLVALKELRPVLLTDKEWTKRFRREAKTIAHLDHAHIVTIYDVYEVDERLFIVMPRPVSKINGTLRTVGCPRTARNRPRPSISGIL